MRRVLLDANLLIAAFDPEATTSAAKVDSAKRRLRELLSDPDVALAITPLIRYEVLRGIDWDSEERYEAVRDRLDALDEFDVRERASDLAVRLYRFERFEKAGTGEEVVDKRGFDRFHFAVAKLNGLELASEDGHAKTFETLHERLEAASDDGVSPSGRGDPSSLPDEG